MVGQTSRQALGIGKRLPYARSRGREYESMARRDRNEITNKAEERQAYPVEVDEHGHVITGTEEEMRARKRREDFESEAVAAAVRAGLVDGTSTVREAVIAALRAGLVKRPDDVEPPEDEDDISDLHDHDDL